MDSTGIAAGSALTPSSTPPWGFLDWWSFFGTLATLVGLILALAGLYVALKQIQRTLDATRASAVTAVRMSRQQLNLLLANLTGTQAHIEQAVESGDITQILVLLDSWMRLASEVTGFMEQFELPIAQVGTAAIMSQLGLEHKTNGASADSQYVRLQVMLVGSISSAKQTRPSIERARSGARLRAITSAWRDSVREVVLESAQFQGQMQSYLSERSATNGS
jgi:hypothetical protein